MAHWKYRVQKWRKEITVCAPSHNFVRLQSKKNLLNSNMSSACLYNMANLTTSGWDRFGSLRHSTKFQRVSRLAFFTAATLFTGGQPRCLAVSWAGTLYLYAFLGALAPMTEFCPVQNSLCIQVLHSHILAALLHSTPAAGVSQTLRRRTRNGITELSHRAPLIFGRMAITLGFGAHSSLLWSPFVADVDMIFLPCGFFFFLFLFFLT